MIETLCDPALLDNSTQPCAQAPCAVFYWRARELADCLPEDPQKPCGRVSCRVSAEQGIRFGLVVHA